MSEYIDSGVLPFDCCSEPVTNLSHDVSELTSPAGPSDIIDINSYMPADPLDMKAFADSIYKEEGVRLPLEQMRRVDPKTYAHVRMVGYCVAYAGVELGLTHEESAIGIRAAATHDQGKIMPEVQDAINAPRTVKDDPSLYNAIATHSWHGVRLLTPHQSPNVLQVIGNHHSLQTNPDRRAYGVFNTIQNIPEADGKRPDTNRLHELVAASDLADAIRFTPLRRAGDRPYQQFEGKGFGSLDYLEVELETLRISDRVRSAVLEVARRDAKEELFVHNNNRLV